jgi:hypothetical protein
MRAHQPGSTPIDIPETVPNPAYTPRPVPAPERGPIKAPEKVPEKTIARLHKRLEFPLSPSFHNFYILQVRLGPGKCMAGLRKRLADLTQDHFVDGRDRPGLPRLSQHQDLGRGSYRESRTICIAEDRPRGS